MKFPVNDVILILMPRFLLSFEIAKTYMKKKFVIFTTYKSLHKKSLDEFHFLCSMRKE